MNMKLECVRMMLLLLGYILCFGEMTNVNNHFVDAEILKSFNDFEIEEQLKLINKPASEIIKVRLISSSKFLGSINSL